jgi:Na+-transporting methylmalonyl-CoA/oxaloacetate decarboxylase gamma subunit
VTAEFTPGKGWRGRAPNVENQPSNAENQAPGNENQARWAKATAAAVATLSESTPLAIGIRIS